GVSPPVFLPHRRADAAPLATDDHATFRIGTLTPCCCHLVNSETNCWTASSVLGCAHICGKNLGGTVRMWAPACIASLMSAMCRMLPTMISDGEPDSLRVCATERTTTPAS